MTSDEAKREINKAFEPAFANYIIEALTSGATCSDKRESSTDAVSREEALEAFKPRGISQDAWEESNVYKTIKALPTVTPERPKGEWIDEINDFGKITAFHCSNCYEDTGCITACKYDFCPSCGADMRGVSQE